MARKFIRRQTLCFLLLVISLTGLGMCQAVEKDEQNSDSNAKEQVLKIADEANQAVLNRSTSTADGLLADEIVWLTSRGEILSKAQVLANIQSGKQTRLSEKSDDNQLHVHGDTVILYATTKPQSGSKEQASPRMTTTVFVKEGGRWKIVARGETVVIP